MHNLAVSVPYGDFFYFYISKIVDLFFPKFVSVPYGDLFYFYSFESDYSGGGEKKVSVPYGDLFYLYL